jgi:hypothetical protein
MSPLPAYGFFVAAVRPAVPAFQRYGDRTVFDGPAADWPDLGRRGVGRTTEHALPASIGGSELETIGPKTRSAPTWPVDRDSISRHRQPASTAMLPSATASHRNTTPPLGLRDRNQSPRRQPRVRWTRRDRETDRTPASRSPANRLQPTRACRNPASRPTNTHIR